MTPSKVRKIVMAMQRSPANVRYSEALRVCEYYFGAPRNRGGSHAVFSTPWRGDPRVNIQNSGGMAKPYQVRQVLAAIREAEGDDDFSS
ncbi:toxin HicA [Paramicrobacterium chengjingii]|uniref:toxin HicA n=1 Tax=Paramicrobacterium chengjingii TaxID=2769067 RepID=UPI001F16679F|nr:toxin HicA [Microbacterium chengjingii]